MTPGTYNIALTENSDMQLSISVSGIVSASGYIVASDFRVGNTPTSSLLLSLSGGNGIAVSSDGAYLRMVMTITEEQCDSIARMIERGPTVCWSLKVTDPAGFSTQYLMGDVSITRTPTP